MPTIHTGTLELQAFEEGGVLTLTLSRSEARNALTDAMLDAFAAQLERAEFDDAVRCVVLTGAGKAFCSGGDVKAMAADEDALPIDSFIQLQRRAQQAIAGRLHRMPKPTIAAINGAAAGAGLALALACDIRTMSADAFVVTAFGKVGLSGDFGGTYFMTKLIGTARARELYFLGERVDAATALSLGLTNRVFAPDAFTASTSALAAQLAEGPAIAYRYMKENLNRAIVGPMEDCLDLEATHHVHCQATLDHQEAVRAFVEKRVPTFVGR